MARKFPPILLALFIFAGLIVACADDAPEVDNPSTIVSTAESVKPLWANVPNRISPEWGVFFSEKGKGREKPMPPPDDLEAWKAVQTAIDEVKEAKADEKAAAFGVIYEESEIAGIPVVR